MIALSDKIAAAIRQISDGRIRFLINTHVHGDHTAGNANFVKMGALLFAREELREEMLRPPATGNPAPARDPARLPVLAAVRRRHVVRLPRLPPLRPAARRRAPRCRPARWGSPTTSPVSTRDPRRAAGNSSARPTGRSSTSTSNHRRCWHPATPCGSGHERTDRPADRTAHDGAVSLALERQSRLEARLFEYCPLVIPGDRAPPRRVRSRQGNRQIGPRQNGSGGVAHHCHCERSEAISRQILSDRRDRFVTFGSSQ